MAFVKPSKVYSYASISTLPKTVWQVFEVWGPMEAMQTLAKFSGLYVNICAVNCEKNKTVLELAKVIISTVLLTNPTLYKD